MRRFNPLLLTLMVNSVACAPVALMQEPVVQESVMPMSFAPNSSTPSILPFTPSALSVPASRALAQLAQSDWGKAQNRFSLKLWQTIAVETADNLILSPLSAALALTLTAQGARDETLAEMRAALQQEGLTPETLLNSTLLLRQRFAHLGAGQQIALTNGLFTKLGMAVAPVFLQAAHDYFGAQAQPIDFTHAQTLDVINTWVKTSTGGKIAQLLQPDDLNSDTLMVLLNAIYFKGTWTRAFEPRLTRNGPFTTVEGDISVPFMVRSGDMSYLDAAGVRGVSLPYGADESLRFYAFLPEQPVSQWLQTLSPEALDALLMGFKARRLHLELPRFRLETSVNLKKPLLKLSMIRAFDESQSDFGALSSQGAGAYISAVRQKAFVEVNEAGTEAAAATAVVMAARVSAPPPSVKLLFNRPFVFLIRDEQTKNLLFTGIVSQP